MFSVMVFDVVVFDGDDVYDVVFFYVYIVIECLDVVVLMFKSFFVEYVVYFKGCVLVVCEGVNGIVCGL